MKTYHGERTDHGCEVTVDGQPLHLRSDLSGNATSPFDWGFVGTGQLSLAMLSDFLGDDPKAKAICEAFEKKVVADLPRASWTLTGQDLSDAVASLTGEEAASVDDDNGAKSPEDRAMHLKTQVVSEAAGDMVNAALQVAAAATAVGNAAHQVAHACDGPADESMSAANRAADHKAAATNRVVDDAAALARAAVDEANRVVAKLLPDRQP